MPLMKRECGVSQHGSSQHYGQFASAAFPTCQHSMRPRPLPQVERVLLRSSLPRTASNKVMRRVLRDELLRGQSKL